MLKLGLFSLQDESSLRLTLSESSLNRLTYLTCLFTALFVSSRYFILAMNREKKVSMKKRPLHHPLLLLT